MTAKLKNKCTRAKHSLLSMIRDTDSNTECINMNKEELGDSENEMFIKINDMIINKYVNDNIIIATANNNININKK